jgi:Beta-propeller repeat
MLRTNLRQAHLGLPDSSASCETNALTSLPVTFMLARTRSRAAFDQRGIACPASGNAYIAKLDPAVSGQQSLIYATYFGGMGSTVINAIALDSSGAAYVTGSTDGSHFGSFPITPDTFQITAGPNSSSASFVTKLNAAGSQLVYSTFVSDLRSSSGNSIAVDAIGNAYIAGQVNGSTFPVTPDAFQSSYSGPTTDFGDAFLAKLNATGSALIYSSYLGGTGDDAATAIAVDQIGDAYIAGHTSSADLPTSIAFQPSMHGTGDAFVSKFSLGAGGALSLLTVYPSQGGNAGAITPTILGSGFHYGANATLNCSGSSIAGGNITVNPDGRTLVSKFSLAGLPPGLCSVTVANPDGTNVSLQSAFTIVQGGSEDIQLDLFGRSGIRGGIWTTYSAGYSNRGTVDSRPFRLWISFPDYFSWSPPPDRAPASAGQLNGNIYVGFDVFSVPAGSSAWIPIQLVAPSTPEFGHQPFTIQVWREKK